MTVSTSTSVTSFRLTSSTSLRLRTLPGPWPTEPFGKEQLCSLGIPDTSGGERKRRNQTPTEPSACMPPFIVHAQKRTSDYAPSYDWGSETLSDRHSRVHDAVWHIPGWLERADAL